jgi:GTPase
LKLPVVSIVGRQNVGKSTLFNALSKKKISITHDYPGVTRDVIHYIVETDNFSFDLCDTPGLDIENFDELSANIIEMSFEQLISSEVIVYLIDRHDFREYDNRLIQLFKTDSRFNNKNIMYCLNKADNPEQDIDLEFFYRQGLEDILPISALGRRNLKVLIEKIEFYIKNFPKSDPLKPDIKISIVGKPNSGKSSLLNAIAGFKRSAVSEISGTTRDSVDIQLKFEEKIFEIIDTAGIRKQSAKTEDPIEFYSYKRALQSVEKSDVVVLLIDATKGVGEFDKKLFTMIRSIGRPMLIAVNKWDLIPEKDSNSFKEYREKMTSRLNSTKDVPVISISALERQRTHKLLQICKELSEKARRKFTTHELNTSFRSWMNETKLSSSSTKKPKLYYVTQTAQIPFRVLLFVNSKESFQSNTINYLKKKMIDKFQLEGIPVEIELRDKESIRKGRNVSKDDPNTFNRNK